MNALILILASNFIHTNTISIPYFDASKISLLNVVIDSVNLNLEWGKVLKGKRIGTSLILKKDEKIIEHATIYYPKDKSFELSNLMDASGYYGEIKMIKRESELKNLTGIRESIMFKIDTPRIIPYEERKLVLDTLKNLPKEPIKISRVSLQLKLPLLNTDSELQVWDLSKNNAKRLLVHVPPNSGSIVIKDLPSHTVLQLTLANNNEMFTNIFTGSLYILKKQAAESSRLSVYKLNRPTVTCYVKNRAPFQGFPCKESNVCIPLHWKCDGFEDCLNGSDEINCNGISTYSLDFTDDQNSNRCRRNEFGCTSRGVDVCLPISWLCDGRTDCSDGYDESRETCRKNQNYHHYQSNCKRDYFKCRKGGCVAPRHVCDGHRDCSDGSDEHDCDDEDDEDNCDAEYEFSCRGYRNKCVPRPWVCDDQDDCPNGEDEDDHLCSNHYHNFND